MLSSPGDSIAARLFRKPTAPARTEILHLPYYCFDLHLSGSTENTSVRVAVDGLAGDVVFFVTDQLESASPEGHEYCGFELSPTEARKIVLDQYKRMLLEHGLRNKTKTTVERISDAEQILYPFWIGYIRKGKAYDFKAIDAVSGEAQGVRMRKVLLTAFRQLERR